MLQNWAKMKISLLGIINLVKIMIAAKLNYILYMLPMSLPQLLLKRFNTVVENIVSTCENTSPLRESSFLG